MIAKQGLCFIQTYFLRFGSCHGMSKNVQMKDVKDIESSAFVLKVPTCELPTLTEVEKCLVTKLSVIQLVQYGTTQQSKTSQIQR